MTLPRLFAIADLETCGSEHAWLALIDTLSRLPVALSLRAKGATLAQRLHGVERALEHGNCVVLNGAISTALLARAHGAHLPEALWTDLPRDRERRAGFVVGASVHDVDGAKRASALGADYLVFAPVFDAISKTKRGAGLSALANVCRASSTPVYALGGVTPVNARACLSAGAYGIASVGAFSSSALGAFTQTDAPAYVANEFLRVLEAPSERVEACP